MKYFKMPSGDIQFQDYAFRKDPDFTNIRWIITPHCNIGCPYCIGYKHDGEPDSMIQKIGVDKVVNRFVRFRDKLKRDIWITMTGGEPTIIPEFPKLCSELAKHGIYIELQTNLTTPESLDFVGEMHTTSPKHLVQVVASYHSWLLDRENGKKHAQIFFENFNRIADLGTTIFLKKIIMPKEILSIHEKFRKLRQNIPAGFPILSQPFISLVENLPREHTDEEKRILKGVMEARREDQCLYMDGGGKFNKMMCGAGRYMLHMQWDGEVRRCWSHKGFANFFEDDFDLQEGSAVCGLPECMCVFLGIWYGDDPWNFVPGYEDKPLQCCRTIPHDGIELVEVMP